MDTLFELTTEGSDEDENVIALRAIELWSKVPKLDGLQCCERNSSFRWINHLQLGLKTQMFSPEEDELIVTLCVIFEQRRAQIATQLTETSQVPIHNFGLLVDGKWRWGGSKKEKEDGKFNEEEEEEEKGDAVVIEAANLKRKKEGEASKRRYRVEMGVSKKEKLKRWGVRRRRKRWCKWWLKLLNDYGQAFYMPVSMFLLLLLVDEALCQGFCSFNIFDLDFSVVSRTQS
ncbi:transcription factor MYB96-like [Solanum stenotomum]|uniref:transcription factor MYB96-like n=1 Tax=Solanum stenotomum TaxID=172797 RepID=UPI0020D0F161|nr:transcription factor MYB96-like [Solanum stenotomum]